MTEDKTQSSPALRFGCGAFWGLLAGIFLAASVAETRWQINLILMGSALLCGWLARRFGDRVLVDLLRMLPW